MKALLTLMLALGLGFAMDAQEVRTENYENGQAKVQYTIFGNYIQMVAYYEDGAVKETGSYLNNQPHGEYRQYSPDGELMSAGEYERGKKQGIWLFRPNGGETLYQVVYEDNVRTDVDRWVAAEQE